MERERDREEERKECVDAGREKMKRKGQREEERPKCQDFKRKSFWKIGAGRREMEVESRH